MVKRVNYIYNNDNLFLINVYIPAGSIYEHYNPKKRINGISHFLEHLLFKNTKNFTGQQILEEFTKIGGYYNASTDKDRTIFYIKTLSENFKIATDLLYDIVMNPVFKKDEIEIERKVVLEELAQTKDSYEENLYEYNTRTILSDGNLYRYPVIGCKEHLQKMTIKQVEEYYRLRYKDCLVLINCDKRHLKSIQTYMSRKFLKSRTNKEISFDETSMSGCCNQFEPSLNKRVSLSADTTFQYNTYITFPSYRYSECKNNTILDFLQYCLTGAGLYSILYYEMREKRGLVYNVKMMNENMRYLGLLRINFGTSNKDLLGILEVIVDILNTIKCDGLQDSKLSFFKRSYLSNIKYKLTNQEFRLLWHGDNLFYSCTTAEKAFIRTIESISNDDIKKVSRYVFDFSKMAINSQGHYRDTHVLKTNIIKLVENNTRSRSALVL